MEFQNKVLPITIILVSLFSFSFFAFKELNHNEMGSTERNYLTEAMLGISPNMDTRQPTENDIDSGLIFKSNNGYEYKLYESRDFITYGKTFLVRIN